MSFQAPETANLKGFDSSNSYLNYLKRLIHDSGEQGKENMYPEGG